MQHLWPHSPSTMIWSPRKVGPGMAEQNILRKSWCSSHWYLEEPPSSRFCREGPPRMLCYGHNLSRDELQESCCPLNPKPGQETLLWRRSFSRRPLQRAWACLAWLPCCFLIFELFSNINFQTQDMKQDIYTLSEIQLFLQPRERDYNKES